MGLIDWIFNKDGSQDLDEYVKEVIKEEEKRDSSDDED